MDLSEEHLLQKHDRYSEIRTECVDTKSQAEEPMRLVPRTFSGPSCIRTRKPQVQEAESKLLEANLGASVECCGNGLWWLFCSNTEERSS